MGVRCQVFIDGSMAGDLYQFAAVPQIGDSVQIEAFGEHMVLRVEDVLHVAKGTFADMSDGDVQIQVSTARARAKAHQR